MSQDRTTHRLSLRQTKAADGFLSELTNSACETREFDPTRNDTEHEEPASVQQIHGVDDHGSTSGALPLCIRKLLHV